MFPGLPPCPDAPDWLLRFDSLSEDYEWLSALRGCPQDPEHHAEGDVWIHTRMVAEAMVGLPAFRAASAAERPLLFAAALLHDVAKPDCTCMEEGRLRAPHHGPRGALIARAILWRLGAPPRVREAICALVRVHQVPFHLIDRRDAARVAYTISQTVRCDHLALLAQADALGRVCRDQPRILDQVALFAEFCAEHGCLRAPRAFPSDHSRFLYFRQEDRDPDYLAHDDTRGEVILMSGLPGSGKSTEAARRFADRPHICLDDLRRELGVDPDDGQATVVEEGRRRARVLLREGASFVWNATSLTRQMRGQIIDLCASYRARVRIVYVESPLARLQRQNREREARVPQAVIDRMVARWEVPDQTEAHQVEWVLHD